MVLLDDSCSWGFLIWRGETGTGCGVGGCSVRLEWRMGRGMLGSWVWGEMGRVRWEVLFLYC